MKIKELLLVTFISIALGEKSYSSPGQIYPQNDLFKAESSWSFTSPGLDSELLPIVGGGWDTFQRYYIDQGCGQLMNMTGKTPLGYPLSDYGYNAGLRSFTLTQYIDPTKSCDGVTAAEDPLGRFSWIDVGLVKTREAGLDVVGCSISQGNCPGITLTKETKEKVFSNISAGVGESGTAPGHFSYFGYSVEGMTLSRVPGKGGSFGSSDLPPYSTGIKQCIQVRDYFSDPESVYADSPILNVKFIDFVPIKTSQSNISGDDGTFSEDGIQVFTGLGPSMIYFIDQDNIYNGIDWD